MDITTKQRAQLRAMANTLDTTLYVGKDGITANTQKEAYDLLQARELIKCAVQQNSPSPPGRPVMHCVKKQAPPRCR